MGRLVGNITYLGGAMDNDPTGGVEWRREITPWLQEKLGVLVLDPSNKKVIGKECDEFRDRGEIDSLKKLGKYEDIRKIYGEEIRSLDLRATDLASFGIFYWDNDVRTVGTTEEIFNMNRQKKPVLIICKQGKVNFANWFYFTLDSTMIFNNWQELKNYLIYIDRAETVDERGRWRFFDWQNLFRETEQQYGKLY